MDNEARMEGVGFLHRGSNLVGFVVSQNSWIPPSPSGIYCLILLWYILFLRSNGKGRGVLMDIRKYHKSILCVGWSTRL